MSSYSRFAIKALHLLVTIAVLLTIVPTPPRASAAVYAVSSPPEVDSGEGVSQTLSPQPQVSVDPEPASPQASRGDGGAALDPMAPERSTVQTGTPYSHTVFLPLAVRDYTPPPPAAAIALEQWVQPWLALPGDPVTYTLAVASVGQLTARESALVDRLPQQLELLEAEGATYKAATRELRWDLGNLNPGQTATVTLQARVAEGVAMSVVENEATFTAKEMEPVIATATLRVGERVTDTLSPEEGGELTSPDGWVRVAVPADAITETSVLTLTTYAASVSQAYADPAPFSDPERGLVRFEIEAVRAGDGEPISALLRPARIIVDMHWEDPEGTNPGWYVAHRDHDDPTVWHGLEAYTIGESGLISATTDHFSDFAAGPDPTHWKLTWQEPAVSAFSGAATYAYPIELPPGRGGLRPNLDISYSSRGVDGQTESDVNQGPIGLGWSLNSVEIAREGVKTEDKWGHVRMIHPDKFALILNGARYPLRTDEDTANRVVRYHVTNAPQLYVERRYDPSIPDADTNPDKIYWILRTSDGTTYRLGYTPDSASGQSKGHCLIDTKGSQNEGACDCAYTGGSCNCNCRYSGIRWLVDTVTDVHGDQIQYRYTSWEERELQKSHTPDSEGKSHDTHCTTYHSRISEIRYNYRDRAAGAETRLTSDYATRVLFKHTADRRIDKIELYHGDPRRLYRVIDLTLGEEMHHAHSQHTRTRMLKRITERAGGRSLPPVSFGYVTLAHGWDTYFQYEHLQHVNNGYSGVVAFTYMDGGDGRKASGWQELEKGILPAYGKSFPVVKKEIWDGVHEQPAVVEYSYYKPCYDQNADENSGDKLGKLPDATTCRTYGSKSYSLVGFAVTTETVKGYPGEPPGILSQRRSSFSQVKQTMGKPTLQEVLDPTDGEPLSSSDPHYTTVEIGPATFSYADRVISTDHSGSQDVSTRVDYEHDGYGNLTAEYHYGDVHADGDERSVHRGFYPNTTAWIVSRIAWENVYEDITENADVPALKTQTLYYYDGASDFTAAPTKGALTQVDRGLRDWLVPTSYGYDDWGNRTSETDPNGHTTRIAYDSAYHLYPREVFNAKNHRTESEYYGFDGVAADHGLPGQVKQVIGPNGKDTATEYRYDDFGRLTDVIRPGDTVALPTVSYAYELVTERVFFEDFEEACQGRQGERPRGWGAWRVDAECRSGGAYDGDWRVNLTDHKGALHRALEVLQPAPYQMVLALKGKGALSVSLHGDDGEKYHPLAAGAGDSWREVKGTFAAGPGTGDPKFHVWARFSEERLDLDVDRIEIGRVVGLRVTETRREESGCKECTRPVLSFYDGLGRLIQTRAEKENAASQSVTNVTYDGLGRTLQEYVPEEEPFSWDLSRPAGWDGRPHTTTQYDVLGRVTGVTNPDGSQTRTEYDGWKTAVVDANGHRRRYTSDAYGRLVQVEEYEGQGAYTLYATTRYEYDTLDNLVWVEDALGHTTVITYDALGRKTAMDDPDMGHWEYGYDPAGNLKWQEDAQGQRLRFTYDELNRSVEKWLSGSIETLAEYEYDCGGTCPSGNYGVGQHTAMSYPGGSASYRYDARGRVTSETRRFNRIEDYTTQYTYDTMDRVKTMTYPDGEVVTQIYNAQELPESLSSNLGRTFVTGSAYNASGQATHVNLGNGLQTIYTYYPWDTPNGLGRLHRIRTGTSSEPASLQHLTYAYDAVGNVLSIADRKNGGQVQSFHYDFLDRLIEAETTSGGEGAYDRQYQYDEIGNIVTRQGLHYEYHPDHPHAVQHLRADVGMPVPPVATYDYDANGNMVEREENGVTYAQEFGVENRLAAVTDTATGEATRFVYDGDGALMAKITGEGTTIYVGGYFEEFFPGLTADDWALEAGSPAMNGPSSQAVTAAEGDAGGRLATASPWEERNIPREDSFPDPPAGPPLERGTQGLAEPPAISPQSGGTMIASTGGDFEIVILKTESTECPCHKLQLTSPPDAAGWLFGGGNVVGHEGEREIRYFSAGSTIRLADYHCKSNCSSRCRDYIPFPLYSDDSSSCVDLETEGTDHWKVLYEDFQCGAATKDLRVKIRRINQLTPPSWVATGPECSGSAARTLSWTSQAGWWYRVQRATNASFTQNLVSVDKQATGSTTSHTFTGHGTGTYYYRVQCRGGNNNDATSWISVVRRHDRSAPVTSRSLSGTTGDNGWYRSLVRVTLSASDPGCGALSATYYRLDNGGWRLYNSPFTVGTGLHTLRYYSQDSLSNTETEKSLSLKVDPDPPVVSIGLEGYWNPGASPSATDATSGIRVRTFYVDGVARTWKAYDDLCQELSLYNGTHTAWVYAKDEAGNDEDTTKEAFGCDYAKPVVSTGLKGAWNPSANPTATDATSGIETRTFYVDGSSRTWRSYSDLCEELNLSDGENSHTARVYAKDKADNENDTGDERFSCDHEPPQVGEVSARPPIFSPALGQVITVSTHIGEDFPHHWSVTIFDQLETVVRTATGQYADVSFDLEWQWDGRDDGGAIVPDGTYIIQVSATDQAGNHGSQATTAEVDTTPPTLILTQPTHGLHLGYPQLFVKGSAQDGGSGMGTVIVKAFHVGQEHHPILDASGAFTQPLPSTDLAPGRNYIVAVAYDRVGNQTSVAHIVFYDNLGPIIADPRPTGKIAQTQPTIAATFSVTGTAAVSPTSALVELDGEEVTAEANVSEDGFTYTPPQPLSTGPHAVHVEVDDVAGNPGETNWTFEVDLSTWVTLTRPLHGRTLNTLTATVKGKAEKGAVVSLTVNGANAGQTTASDGTFRFDAVSLVTGSNTIAVAATDGLGHQATDALTVTVSPYHPWGGVVANPPVFSPGGCVGRTTFELEARPPSGETIAGWELRVLGESGTMMSANGSGHPPATVTWDGAGAAEGDYHYTLAVTATNDLATITPPQIVRVDLTPPDAPTITVPSKPRTVVDWRVWVMGTAEPGSTITLLDGGYFTTTLTQTVGLDGQWNSYYSLHGGRNRIWAIASDTTCEESPPSNAVFVTQVAEPPLYTVGVTPTTVAAGDLVTLWATARADNQMEGEPTVGVWSWPPDGSEVTLTHTQVLSDGAAGLWTATWRTQNQASDDYPVFYEGVDGDNRSGRGETALAIRNKPPAPRITYPIAPRYTANPSVPLEGEVERGYLKVRVFDGSDEQAEMDLESVFYWGTRVTLVGDGPHPLRARAEDDFGQISDWSNVMTVTLDTAPPEVTMTPLAAYTGAEDFAVGWQGTDPPAGSAPGSGVLNYDLQWRFEGGAWRDWMGSVAFTEAVYRPAQGDGAYSFRARARDRLGNRGAYAEPVETTVDRVAPSISLTLRESDPHAHVDGDTVYYGPADGAFTVRANLADATSGVAQVVFPATTGPGETYPQGGAHQAAQDHAYTFTGTSDEQGAYEVTATDRAGNASTDAFSVVRDAVRPGLTLHATMEGDDILVTWSAADAGSGLAACALEVREEGAATWTWLTDDCVGPYTYTDATQGQRYIFRLSATDNVGNQARAEAETASSGVTKYYYHGGQRVATARGGVVYYLHADHLGSTSLATCGSADGCGGVAYGEAVPGSRTLYLPYGQVRSNDSTLPTDLTFTGQRDVGLGLMHYGARFYDPYLGRFISADTIVPEPGNPQDLNRYAYVRNCPLRYTDPSGHLSDSQIQQMTDYDTEEEFNDLVDLHPDLYYLLGAMRFGDTVYYTYSDLVQGSFFDHKVRRTERVGVVGLDSLGNITIGGKSAKSLEGMDVLHWSIQRKGLNGLHFFEVSENNSHNSGAIHEYDITVGRDSFGRTVGVELLSALLGLAIEEAAQAQGIESRGVIFAGTLIAGLAVEFGARHLPNPPPGRKEGDRILVYEEFDSRQIIIIRGNEILRNYWEERPPWMPRYCQSSPDMVHPF